MAIIQLSQIKIRRGLREDLPNPSLEEGELGLTLDTGELFIGTPNYPPAAARSSAGVSSFPFANTQILTEWSDNVKNLLRYTYRFRNITFDANNASYSFGADQAFPLLTYVNSLGNTINKPIVQKLQEKLDDYVSVKSYGARGDASYSLTTFPDNEAMSAEIAAIRRAAVDVVNGVASTSNPNEWRRRKLLFPAGVYAVNDSLLIPPGSNWTGEGKENTIIALCSTANVQFGFNDCLAFTVDGGLLPEDSNTTSAIAAHSYQNMGISSSAMPNFIEISNMTFLLKKDALDTPWIPLDIIRLIGSKNVIFRNCSFIGNWSFNRIGPAGSYEVKASSNGLFYYPGNGVFDLGDSVAIVVDSNGSINPTNKPSNVFFINCDIENATYGTLITDDVSNIHYTMCSFNRLFRGISISEPLVLSGTSNTSKIITQGEKGPRFISVSNSYFSNIKREGILVFPVSGLTPSDLDIVNPRDNFTTEDFSGGVVLSLLNRFENVGNDDTNEGEKDFSTLVTVSAVSPVIKFAEGTRYCISIGDSFSRNFAFERTTKALGENFSRIEYDSLGQHIIINGQDFISSPVRRLILNPNSSAESLMSFRISNNNNVIINYSLVVNDGAVSNRRRTGTLRILSDGSLLTSLDEDSTDVSTPIPVIFSSNVSGNDFNLRYINSDIDTVTMYFSLNSWNNKQV